MHYKTIEPDLGQMHVKSHLEDSRVGELQGICWVSVEQLRVDEIPK